MSQHDEKVEVDLIKGIRAAEDAGDHLTRNRLFKTLRCLYENDADQLAMRFFRKDEVSRGNLRGHLLARLDSPIRNYDYEAYDSFHLYVMRGWKRYAIREYRRQVRSQGSAAKGVDRSKVVSLDARVSSDEDSSRHVDMVPDAREGQNEPDGRDLLAWLCTVFGVNDASNQAALCDTINGDAGPAARRIGLSILSRKIEHHPSISRFWASRFWADAAARRRLWRELAESLPAPD